MKGVEIIGILIVLKVRFNGFGMKDVVHVISYGKGLSLPDKIRHQSDQGIEQCHSGRKTDEKASGMV